LQEYKNTSQGESEIEFLLKANPTADRKAVFRQTIDKIRAHNSDLTKTYKLGVNSYTDFTDEEFTSYFNLGAPQNECSATHKGSYLKDKVNLQDLPAFFDWRDVGGVTPVKN